MKNITPCCESLRNLTYHFGKMTTSAARESVMNKSTLGYLFVLTDATMIAPENHKKTLKLQFTNAPCCIAVFQSIAITLVVMILMTAKKEPMMILIKTF